MLFPTNIKIIKITKDRLINSLRNNALMEISIIEPVSKSTINRVKQELDKAIKYHDMSIVLLKHKKTKL